MSFKIFSASNIVIAAGEGRINSDSWGFGIELKFNSGNTVESSDSVDLWPNWEMNQAFQSGYITQTWKWSNKSALSSNYDLGALSQNAFLGEGIDGSSKLASECLSILSELAEISGEWEATTEKINEHKVSSIGESIRVCGEGHIIIELDWSNTTKTIVLSWWSWAK